MKDRIKLPKLFYAIPSKYPDWPYADRRAIGVNLETSWFRNEPIWRFEYLDTTYEVSREKGYELGRKFVVFGGICPNLIPIAAVDRVISPEPSKKPKTAKNTLF